jgi:hypothetical protein
MTYDPAAVMDELMQPRPGWTGHFVTSNAPGAHPAGSRVYKAAQDASGDFTALGTLGTVLGSMDGGPKGLAYFIEWDDKPKCAVLAVAWKIGLAR